MTTKKSSLAKKPATPRRPAPANDKAGKTFERSVPAGLRLRPNPPTPFPKREGGAVDAPEETMSPPAQEGAGGQGDPSPRELILRLVETLKGL
jgi:hypothetical protein